MDIRAYIINNANISYVSQYGWQQALGGSTVAFWLY
jgi:hypothetical protein